MTEAINERILMSRQREKLRKSENYQKNKEIKKRKLVEANTPRVTIVTIEGSNSETSHRMAIIFDGDTLFELTKDEFEVYNFHMVAPNSTVCNFGNVTSTVVHIPSHGLMVQVLSTCHKYELQLTEKGAALIYRDPSLNVYLN
jgi:hypothetical protein